MVDDHVKRVKSSETALRISPPTLTVFFHKPKNINDVMRYSSFVGQKITFVKVYFSLFVWCNPPNLAHYIAKISKHTPFIKGYGVGIRK